MDLNLRVNRYRARVTTSLLRPLAYAPMVGRCGLEPLPVKAGFYRPRVGTPDFTYPVPHFHGSQHVSTMPGSLSDIGRLRALLTSDWQTCLCLFTRLCSVPTSIQVEHWGSAC